MKQVLDMTQIAATAVIPVACDGETFATWAQNAQAQLSAAQVAHLNEAMRQTNQNDLARQYAAYVRSLPAPKPPGIYWTRGRGNTWWVEVVW